MDKREPSADSPEEISKHMPSAEQQYKDAQEVHELFNRNNRAGAGGTKAGLVGLRPKGLKKASEFIDKYTPGKYQAPARPFSQTLESPKNTASHGEIDKLLRAVCERRFCPDCNRYDRPLEGGAINLTVYTEAHPEMGISKNDAIVSFFCQECCETFRALRNDPASQLKIKTAHGEKALGEIKGVQRLHRVKDNTTTYLRIKWMNNVWGEDSIYVKRPTD
jgi:hypothetical protein